MVVTGAYVAFQKTVEKHIGLFGEEKLRAILLKTEMNKHHQCKCSDASQFCHCCGGQLKLRGCKVSRTTETTFEIEDAEDLSDFLEHLAEGDYDLEDQEIKGKLIITVNQEN